MHFSYSLRGTDSNLNNVAVEYSFADLYAATDGFSVSHKLGSGSYGSVYRGTLRDGSDVAIKQLKQPKEGGFLEEVTVLSRFRHPHLVILMGFARNGVNRYLVYELLKGVI